MSWRWHRSLIAIGSYSGRPILTVLRQQPSRSNVWQLSSQDEVWQAFLQALFSEVHGDLSFSKRVDWRKLGAQVVVSLLRFGLVAAPLVVGLWISSGATELDQLAAEAIALVAPGEGPPAERAVGETSLTYGELNARANRLARHLIRLGVGPECLVGITVDRSAEMGVALLGILKAGGAYVPLAADLPQRRRDRLLADAGLRHVVTLASHRHLYEAAVEHVVTLNGDAGQPASESEENPVVALTPDRPAYVNHTSGSTGQPKGVLLDAILGGRPPLVTDVVTDSPNAFEVIKSQHLAATTDWL